MRRVLLLASCLALPSLAMLHLQGSSPSTREETAPVARAVPWARPPVSFVVGSPESPTDGEIVVGLLIPRPARKRLADWAPPGTWELFLREERGDVILAETEDPQAEQEEFSNPFDGAERWEAALAGAAAAVTKRMKVRVSFRHVFAAEVEGLALVLVRDPILAGDRPHLLAARVAGTRVQCVQGADPDFGDLLPPLLPDDQTPLVELIVDAIRSSPAIARLDVDPLEVVRAERDGDDVVVRLRGPVADVSLRTLSDGEIKAIVPLPDGMLRVRCPDPGNDPRAHRIVARTVVLSPSGPRDFARAWTIAELVGAADRRVLAPNVAEAGAAYAPRVVYANSKTGAPVAGISERLALLVGEATVAEAHGVTDALGLLDARLTLPEDVPAGPARLLVGDDAFPIEIGAGVRVCVVTDRALYQPTDVVHARVMAHRAATGRPVVGAEVLVRCGDVSKHVTTSTHGIASAEFHLLGALSVRSSVEVTVAGAKARAPFAVSAFETPSFTVACEPARVRFQGDEGTPLVVAATYVNGSPMVGAKVSFEFNQSRVSVEPGEARTDGLGRASFQVSGLGVRGRPSLRVRVEDVDGRSVEVPLFSVEDPPAPSPLPGDLGLEALDEPVAGLPGRFEVRGHGKGPVTVRLPGGEPMQIELDAAGRGTFTWTPFAPWITAGLTPSGGARVERRLSASVVSLDGRYLVRPARRTAVVGETLDVVVHGPDGTAFVELARDSTVLRTRLVRVAGGSARLTFSLDADLGGVLRLRAGRDDTTKPSGSQVAVLVSRGRSLSVTARANAESWRPGETASVDVEVTDRSGRPTAAVLGYWGVDEALLALEPMIDGQEDAFDTLPPGALPAVAALATARERGLPGELATFRDALGPIEPLEFLPKELSVTHRTAPVREAAVRRTRTEHFRNAVAACRASVVTALRSGSPRDVRVAGSLLGQLRGLVRDGRLDAESLRDPWGTPMAVGRGLVRLHPPADEVWHPASFSAETGVEIRSAGPDLMAGTADDLVMAWAPLAPEEIGGRVGLWLEHVLSAIEGESMGEEAVATAYAEEFEGPALRRTLLSGRRFGRAYGGRGGHRNLRAGGGGSMARDPVRVRTDFSPTLCFVPEAIVGPEGRARLEVPLKDAITTWRMRFVASAADGATGIGETRLHVTQPLHLEPFIARHLTVGDELELPVSVRNETALDVTAHVRLTVSPELVVVGIAESTAHVAPHGTGVVVFRLRAVAPGTARVRIDAASSASSAAPGASDAIERTVVVRRDARPVVEMARGTLEASTSATPTLPAAPAGPAEHRVTFYSSPMADVLGGFEGLIAAPHGCFEQTSATLHPMVLALRYLRKTGQAQPELAARAQTHVAAGAERLTSYEVAGSKGGFSLWGRAPASLVLTAYALAEFRDLAEVHPVDPALRARIASWLLAQQHADGSWSIGKDGPLERTDVEKGRTFDLTAYIACSFSRAGAPSATALGYLSAHAGEVENPYGLALAALAHLTADEASADGHRLVDRLAVLVESDAKGHLWRPIGETGIGSRGECASIEATALAIQALVRGGRHAGLVSSALERLLAWRSPDGRFGTTQSTILALDALLCVEESASRGDVEVTVRGAGTDRVVGLDARSTEPVHVDLPSLRDEQGEQLAFHAKGTGSVRFTVTRTTYVPWSSPRRSRGPLALDVTWPADVLPAGQVARANVSVRNDSTKAVARAVTLEIGIPPGCDVDPRDVRNSTAVRVERAPTALVIYLEDLPAGESAEFVIPFRPRYAIDVLTAPSKAYEYYVPEEAVEVAPARVRAERL